MYLLKIVYINYKYFVIDDWLANCILFKCILSICDCMHVYYCYHDWYVQSKNILKSIT